MTVIVVGPEAVDQIKTGKRRVILFPPSYRSPIGDVRDLRSADTLYVLANLGKPEQEIIATIVVNTFQVKLSNLHEGHAEHLGMGLSAFKDRWATIYPNHAWGSDEKVLAVMFKMREELVGPEEELELGTEIDMARRPKLVDA